VAIRAAMNAKRKGARAERRAIGLLEAAGYQCTKAGGSLGVFDIIAIGPHDVKGVQVKAGTARCRPLERAQLQRLPVPATVSKEIWRFPDRCRVPLIEQIN
jgi:Holliday junction resolvase